MNKTEYVAALRELTDFVESKPFSDSLKWSWGTELNFFIYDKEEFAKVCLALGSFKKESNDAFTSAKLELPLGAKINVYGDKNEICEKVVVGKRIVPAQPAKTVPAVEEHEEDVFEWKCPESFLGLAAK